MTIGQSILGLILPIMMLFLGLSGETTLLSGVGLSFLIIVVYIILFGNSKVFINQLNKKQKDSNILLKKWFFYGGPLSIWFAAGMALPFLDRFFINKYLSNYELGVYSGIQELLTRIYSLILFPFILSIHPRIMNAWNSSNFEEAKKLIKNSIKIILSFGIVIFWIAWEFNDIIFASLQIAIPQLRDHNKELIMPLLSAGFLWQLSFLTHKILEIKEKTFIMLIAILPSLMINIIGNSLFLPKFGYLATANTAFFSALMYCFLTFFYSINQIKKI